MGRQINIFMTEDDHLTIISLLKEVFGELLTIPLFSHEDSKQLTSLEIGSKNKYLVQTKRFNNIVYKDNNALDFMKSPVMEYYILLKNEQDMHLQSRFYCCCEDLEFNKKVAIFFRLLKKEFFYVKLWSCYISKHIDVDNSLFYIPNKIINIKREDLK